MAHMCLRNPPRLPPSIRLRENCRNFRRLLGGRSRNRTYSKRIKSPLLYQLSYAPVREANVCLGSSSKSRHVHRFALPFLAQRIARSEGIEPPALGFEALDGSSQCVADGSESLEIQPFTRGDLSRMSPRNGPDRSPFGAIVVQARRADGSDSSSAGPYLTVREVAARLRVCTATVYRLCEAGRLPHVRVSNAVRVSHLDLQAFLQTERR